MTPFPTGASHKPILDEAGFEQLLAAAFVLQQHNDTLRAKDPDADPVAVLSKLSVRETDSQPDFHLSPVSRTPTLQEMLADDEAERCRICARPFGTGEEFCGGCGQPRKANIAPEELQSKWASLWYMQRAQKGPSSETFAPPAGAIAKEAEEGVAERVPDSLTKEAEPEVAPAQPISLAPEEDGLPGEEEIPASEVPELPAGRIEADSIARSHLWEMAQVPHAEELRTESPHLSEELPEPVTQPAPRDHVREHLQGTVEPGTSEPFLSDAESEEPTEGWQRNIRLSVLRAALGGRQRWGTVALAATTLLLGLVLWSATPASAGGQPTWLQSWLVRLGVKNAAPQVSPYGGDPNMRVWIDVHTGLYYCPGSDLYGKTPGGRFSKQHAAQKDEFQPSTNVPCE